MKRCLKCNRIFEDATLNFCLDDGTPLTPRFDSEAETLRPKPALSSQDIIMEMANFLRGTVSPGTQTLIRFEDITIALAITAEQASEHLEAAANKADCAVIDRTDTRATIRRESARIVRA